MTRERIAPWAKVAIMTSPGRQRERFRRRGFGRKLASLVVASLVGAGTSCGMEAAGPSSQPLARVLNGDRLPHPMSSVAGLGRYLAYYALNDEERLVLTVVDPAASRVVWQRAAFFPPQPSGVALNLASDGAAVYSLAEGSGGGAVLERLRADGSRDWSVTLIDPIYMPQMCDGDLCVRTADGLDVRDARTGRRLRHFGFDDGYWIVAADRDGALAVQPGARESESAVAVHGSTGRGWWDRTVASIFGSTPVTSLGGWSARRRSSGWVLWLGSPLVSSDATPVYPASRGRGAVAGIRERDGTAEWVRDDLSPCDGAIDHAAVMCDGSLRFETADAAPAFPVSSIQVLDLDTGETTTELRLHQALDLVDSRARVVRTGEASWLVRDGAEWRSLAVDGPASASSAIVPGWCPGVGGGLVSTHSMDGEMFSFTAAATEYPCTTGSEGNELTSSQIPIHAEALARSATLVNRWAVWVRDDGTLQGFRLNDEGN